MQRDGEPDKFALVVRPVSIGGGYGGEVVETQVSAN